MVVKTSELAEYGLIRVNRELARFRQVAVAEVPLLRSRLPNSPTLQTDSPAQDSLMRLVSYAEHFVTGLALDVIEQRTPLLGWSRRKLQSALRDSSGTWEQRRALWAQLGVDLTMFSADEPFRGFIEARNAVAHGLGRLTWRQTSNPASRAEALRLLAAAGLQVVEWHVRLTEEDIERLAETVNQLIEWLDSASQPT